MDRLDFGPGEEPRRERLDREGNSRIQLARLNSMHGAVQQLSALTQLVLARAEREHELVLVKLAQLDPSSS